MMVRKAYAKVKYSGCMLSLTSCVAVCLIILIFSFSAKPVFSQELPDYDEISVFIDMPEVGGGEIDALIKGTELYLPVTDLFDFLKIKNIFLPPFFEFRSIFRLLRQQGRNLFCKQIRKPHYLSGAKLCP